MKFLGSGGEKLFCGGCESLFGFRVGQVAPCVVYCWEGRLGEERSEAPGEEGAQGCGCDVGEEGAGVVDDVLEDSHG